MRSYWFCTNEPAPEFDSKGEGKLQKVPKLHMWMGKKKWSLTQKFLPCSHLWHPIAADGEVTWDLGARMVLTDPPTQHNFVSTQWIISSTFWSTVTSQKGGESIWDGSRDARVYGRSFSLLAHRFPFLCFPPWLFALIVQAIVSPTGRVTSVFLFADFWIQVLLLQRKGDNIMNTSILWNTVLIELFAAVATIGLREQIFNSEKIEFVSAECKWEE